MKLIGIDYGRRRIGVAVSDDGIIARGLTVIDRKIVDDPAGELLKIITNENAKSIVFGLPLDIDDNDTEMSREVKSFAASISSRTNIPTHFVDESYTSQKAEELKMFRKKKARRDKSLSDRIAACLILQDFIDNYSK